ncbi:MAG: hypothetical protein WCK69_02905 [Candidatus Saccharibacteria bacterium]
MLQVIEATVKPQHSRTLTKTPKSDRLRIVNIKQINKIKIRKAIIYDRNT